MAIIEVTEQNFQEVVLESKKPVLVDFWATWCGYCTKLSPILDEIAGELTEKIEIVKIDADKNRGLAQKYSIASLPTMFIFKNGENVEKIMGYMPKDSLLAKITPHI